MNIYSVQGLSKAHGLKHLFTDVSFGIEERDRIGIIGANGSGKSTLLKILAGTEPSDAGNIARKQDIRIEFLDQKRNFEPGQTVLDCLLSGEGEVAALVREYELLSLKLESEPEDAALLRKMEQLTRRMDVLGAWEIETRAKTVLSKLGIRDLESRVENLSPGYRKRVALARALLAPCDLLILDEPTNHLDTFMIAWLEDYLKKFAGAVLLVTHDRYFLDRITRVIFEIERGTLRRFEGNFSYYLERKAEIENALDAADQRRRSILRHELAWLKRGARARTTKEKARIKKYHELKDQVVDRTVETLTFKSGNRRLGGKILSLEGVNKTLGGKMCVKDFSHTMPKGERLGIIGPNGCGKTTLVNLITGNLQPDSGKIEIGETVHIGYYDQESKGLDPNERALEYVKREGGEMLRAPDGAVMTAAAVMEHFLFTPQMLYLPIGKLSGGEQRRLYLVRTLMRDPNVLILDEPTNDLDIATLQSLEDYLDGFAGCLIVISHDRYFLDRTVDCVIANDGGGHWAKYPGGYDVYLEMKAEQEVAERESSQSLRRPVSVAVTTENSPKKSSSTRLSFKEQKELDGLEESIEQMEKRLVALQSELISASSDYVRLKTLSHEQRGLNDRLQAAMTRWEELSTRASQALKK